MTELGSEALCGAPLLLHSTFHSYALLTWGLRGSKPMYSSLGMMDEITCRRKKIWIQGGRRDFLQDIQSDPLHKVGTCTYGKMRATLPKQLQLFLSVFSIVPKFFKSMQVNYFPVPFFMWEVYGLWHFWWMHWAQKRSEKFPANLH